MKESNAQVAVTINNIGWRTLIMTPQDAVALIAIMGRAKVFDTRYDGEGTSVSVACKDAEVDITTRVPDVIYSEEAFTALRDANDARKEAKQQAAEAQ